MHPLELGTIFEAELGAKLFALLSRPHLPSQIGRLSRTNIEHLMLLCHHFLNVGVATRCLENHMIFPLKSCQMLQFLHIRLIIIGRFHRRFGHIM